MVRGVAVEAVKTRWEDIGGLPEVKKRLQQAVEWPLNHSHSFQRLGIKAPRGVLLHGPPGELGRGVPIKAPPAPIKGPPAIYNFIKTAF